VYRREDKGRGGPVEQEKGHRLLAMFNKPDAKKAIHTPGFDFDIRQARADVLAGKAWPTPPQIEYRDWYDHKGLSMTSKQLFLQNDGDTKFMLGVVSSPRFERALLYAKGAWQEGDAGQQPGALAAVNSFLDVLLDLPVDEPDTPGGLPPPKLHRSLDVPRERPQRKKEPEQQPNQKK
jgi:hypothetical protein